MQLPPYVLIEHPTELKDKTLIMATTTPYIIGQVWRFKDAEEFDAWMRRNPGTRICLMPGYNMLVSFYGQLTEDFHEPNLAIVIMDALNGMRDFYHSVRIAPSAPRYNRYKID